MYNWLYQLNKSYDQLEEPKRLFYLVCIAMIGIIPCGYADRNMWVGIAGMTYLILLILIRDRYFACTFTPKK